MSEAIVGGTEVLSFQTHTGREKRTRFIRFHASLWNSVSPTLFPSSPWDTVHHIHEEMMEEALESRAEELRKAKYKPTRLAVDEFAIHKGHTYATCVMDLDTGEVIWAGKGRSKEDFKHFFDDMPKGYLSKVCAVAMDMNASYNILFAEKLPKAVIVYDRYHMQAQYGKDVLGAVRLQEARMHQSEAKNILETAESLDDPEQKRRLKAEAKEEKQRYSQLKGLRWTLLTNGAKLSDEKAQHLQSILSESSMIQMRKHSTKGAVVILCIRSTMKGLDSMLG